MEMKQDIETNESTPLNERINALEEKIASLEKQLAPAKSDVMTILVTSGDYDKLLTAFILASGAASVGFEVKMFFSFWGISALKKNVSYSDKNIYEKMMTLMMPKDASKTPLSNMNMFGVGKIFMKKIMKDKGICSLSDIINQSLALGIEISVCQMTMHMMGISKEELCDGIIYGGVVSCVDKMSQSQSTLVI